VTEGRHNAEYVDHRDDHVADVHKLTRIRVYSVADAGNSWACDADASGWEVTTDATGASPATVTDIHGCEQRHRLLWVLFGQTATEKVTVTVSCTKWGRPGTASQW